MKKKLFTLVLLLSFVTIPVFAETQDFDSQKVFKQYVLKNQIPDINETYINNVSELCYSQFYSNNIKDAIKTSEYFVNISEEYYGAEALETLKAKLLRGKIKTRLLMVKEAQDEFDFVYKAANKIKNEELINEVLLEKAMLYLFIEQPDTALKYTSQIKYGNDPEKYYKLGQSYYDLQNHKKAIEYFNKYYNEVKGKDPYYEYRYEMALARIYNRQGHYTKVAKQIAKAQIIQSTFDGDISKSMQAEINYLKYEYANILGNYDLAKKILDETKALKFDDEEDNLNMSYMNYYIHMRDKKNFNKYLNKVSKLYTQYPEDAVTAILYRENEINFAQATENFEEAEKITDEILKALEPQKNMVPILYAKFLKKAFENKMAQDDFIAAKTYLDMVRMYYQNIVPADSFENASLTRSYGDLYYKSKDFNKAATFYNKALTLALLSQKDNDTANLYRMLAYTSYKKGDKEKAKMYMDKSIEKIKLCYGESSSRTYDASLDKYRLYKEMGFDDEAKLILNEINSMVEIFGVVGNTKTTGIDANAANAYSALKDDNYKKALEYADKVLKNSTTVQEKRYAYGIYYDIYTASGNKIKAFKYKKLAHIK